MLLYCDLLSRGNRRSKRLGSCLVSYHRYEKKFTAQQASIVKLLGHFLYYYTILVKSLLRIPSSDVALILAGKTTVPKTNTLSFLIPFFLQGCQG